MSKQAKWIWYYGDYELYHSLKLHSMRQEFGIAYPPPFSLSNVHPNVRFKKIVESDADDTVVLKVNGKGYLRIDGVFYLSDTPVKVAKGKHTILATIINYSGLPAIYLQGKSIVTDETWEVSLCTEDYRAVGCVPEYKKISDNVEEFPFKYKNVSPISETIVDNGILYDFGVETFGKVVVCGLKQPATVYYGESSLEALSKKDAILYEKLSPKNKTVLRARAFRYIFIDTLEKPEKLYAKYEFLPYEDIGSFSCNEEIVKKIFDVSAYTLRLCSREFYIDGIKRDRWVWSGDAYQSFMINRYICADNEIIKRTIIALLGKPPYIQHINGINDYSAYLVLSVYDYYFASGDADFVIRIYDRVKALFNFIVGRLDENGFVRQRTGDWVFIDWGEMDKQGPHCAEQILLYKTIEVMGELAKIANDSEIVLPSKKKLKQNIYKYFYDEKSGAFIDGYESGKRQIHRQQNVFAILYDFVSDKEKRIITKNVLLNDDIEEIKTPYFKFFELIALCKMGNLDAAKNLLSSYWGGMLSDGATTFYEQFDPNIKDETKYAMYGNKFAKSLCHAWGSGPIYILGRFVAGVEPVSVGGKNFVVKPNTDIYENFNAVVPMNGGKVKVRYGNGKLFVFSDVSGGTLVYKGKQYNLQPSVWLTI